MKSHLKLVKTPLFILVVASKSHVYTVYVYIQYILYDILYCEKQHPFTECQNVKIIREIQKKYVEIKEVMSMDVTEVY